MVHLGLDLVRDQLVDELPGPGLQGAFGRCEEGGHRV